MMIVTATLFLAGLVLFVFFFHAGSLGTLMKKSHLIIVVGISTPLLVILFYIVLLWVGHDFSPHFMKIDSCLDRGGKWDYQENRCEYTEGMPKAWHISPSGDPRSSTIYPFVSWDVIQRIEVGMNENELETLIRDVQIFHHPINAIVYTRDPGGIEYEVAIKLSGDSIVEQLSFKRHQIEIGARQDK